MTRKLVWGTVTVLLLLYVILIYFMPSSRHQPELAAAREASMKRYEALQSAGKVADQNGYLTPGIFDYWAVKGSAKPGSPAELATRDWNQEFSGPATGKFVDHGQLQKKADPKYLAARRAFAAVAPLAQEAFSKPCFVVTYDRPSFSNLVPNFIAIRAVAQALAGYAESLAAEGKEADAVACLGPILQMGHNLQRNNTLIEGMIGIAVQSVGSDAITTCLRPGSKLTAEQWKELAATLQASLPDEDAYLQKMENEYYLCSELFRHPDELAEITDGNVWLTKFLRSMPGVWAREERIYKNLMGDILLAIKAHQPQPLIKDNFASFLNGSTGILAIILIPNGTRAEAQFRLLGCRLRGLIGFCTINAYLSEHGKLPENAPELPPEVVWEPASKRLVAKIPAEVLERTHILEVRQTSSEWLKNDCSKITPEGFVFQF